ncbi:MAG: preprotein translocase subunit YajC [Clostridiales bacterium]|nr:preprotein translocase subunit YajC [Clostridiales bacterium]
MNLINNILLFGSTAASGTGQNKVTPIILMVALFAVMYFVMIRPQKKKQKEEQTMRDAIQIGDEITTIGGIIAKVVTVKEDSLVIETGADRTKMKIMRWAIQTNNTANERMEAEKEAAAAAKKAEEEKAAIDAAVNGKRPKKTKTVANRDAKIEELHADKADTDEAAEPEKAPEEASEDKTEE